ncbi:hypothetical protein [Patulibacter americanus]|uniref:hypothetical protein n=1 Tax=Patulibacter americanus TaxID=588672 RepID=UPI0003B431E1|nr:hypothetical protein [Patulibacter americanus]
MSQEPFDRPPSEPAGPPRADRPGADAASPAGGTAPTDSPGAAGGPTPAAGSAQAAGRRMSTVVPQVAVGVVALVAAAWLAVASAVVTLFGGIAAVAIALVVLAVVLLRWHGRGRGWLALPLLAIAIPAVAVAATGERIAAQSGVEVHVPLTPEEVPRDGYRTGLGEQLVDLRRLTIPAGTTVGVKARSDLSRTVVALPRGACWNLDVRWRTGRLWLPGIDEQQWVGGLDARGRYVDAWARRRRGAWSQAFEGRIALLGRVRRASSGRWVSRVADPGAPTLRVELRSAGSSFVVRDFPDDVEPLLTPTWPMTLSAPLTPAQRRGGFTTPRESPAAARAWERYEVRRSAFAERSRALLDGGCERKVVTP